MWIDSRPMHVVVRPQYAFVDTTRFHCFDRFLVGLFLVSVGPPRGQALIVGDMDSAEHSNRVRRVSTLTVGMTETLDKSLRKLMLLV